MVHVNHPAQLKLMVMKQLDNVLTVQMNAQNVFHRQIVKLVLMDIEFLL